MSWGKTQSCFTAVAEEQSSTAPRRCASRGSSKEKNRELTPDNDVVVLLAINLRGRHLGVGGRKGPHGELVVAATSLATVVELEAFCVLGGG
jgi:hypothetical protein